MSSWTWTPDTTGTQTITVTATTPRGVVTSVSVERNVAAGVPDAPSAPTLAGGVEAATITLSAVGNDNGAAITSYDWQITTAADTGFASVVDFGEVAAANVGSPVVVTGLTAGNFIARFRATNSAGDGAWSAASSAATVESAAAAPDAFTIAMWSLDNSPSVGGDKLALGVTTLPDDNGSALTSLQYQVDSGSGYGAAQTLTGTGTGTRQITVLAETAASVQLRAVNAEGAGAWSDVKSATPTAVSTSFSIRADRTTIRAGQHVSFDVDPATLTAFATETGYSVAELQRRATYEWEFSVGNSAEDYEFTALTADKRGRRTAGGARGPYAAHTYVTKASHTARCTMRVGSHTATSGDVTITVDQTRDEYYAANTAVCDPASDFSTGVNVTPTTTFTDIDAALAWVSVGTGKRLLIRAGTHDVAGKINAAGTNYEGYVLQDNSCIEALGGQVTLNRAFDGITARLRLTAVGGETTLTKPVGDWSNPRVFVNGAQATIGSVSAGTITLAAALTAADDVIVVELNSGLTGVNNPNGSYMITLGKPGVQIIGVTLAGQYDASAPGTWNGTDLASFEDDVHITGFRAVDNSVTATLLNCGVAGLRSGMETTSGVNIHATNFFCDDWYNYGVFLGGEYLRASLSGARLLQNINTINASDSSKTENVIGQANAADHGPIRAPEPDRNAYSCVEARSMNSWGVGIQPFNRSATATLKDMSYCQTECDVGRASGVFAGGTPNKWTALGTGVSLYSGHNWYRLTDEADAFTVSSINGASVADVFHLGESDETGNFAIHGRNPDDDEKLVKAGVTDQLGAMLYINPTIWIAETRAGANLTLGTRQMIVNSGLLNVVGSTVVSGTPSTVNVVVSNSPEASSRSSSAWQVWRYAAGETEADATASATITAQNTIYDTIPNIYTNVDITLLSGTFADGDTIVLVRAPLEEDGETFVVNNRAAPIYRPLPEFENELLVIEGDWASVKIYDTDVATIDPADYRPADYGTFDALLRPQAGNTALASSTGDWSALDVSGGARPATPALGALETDTVVLTGDSETIADNDGSKVVQLATVAGVTAITTGVIVAAMSFTIPATKSTVVYPLSLGNGDLDGLSIRVLANNNRVRFDCGASASINSASLVVTPGEQIRVLVIAAPGGALTVHWRNGSGAVQTLTGGTCAATVDLTPAFLGGLTSSSNIADMQLEGFCIVGTAATAPSHADFFAASDGKPLDPSAITATTKRHVITAASLIAGVTDDGDYVESGMPAASGGNWSAA